jgi:hypothetical protein
MGDEMTSEDINYGTVDKSTNLQKRVSQKSNSEGPSLKPEDETVAKDERHCWAGKCKAWQTCKVEHDKVQLGGFPSFGLQLRCCREFSDPRRP